MKNPRGNNTGMTLVEVLIAVLVSSLVLMGVMRLFSTSVRSYSLQTQLTEMNLNAHYAIRKMTEVFMQAGADLPDTGFTVISPASGVLDDVTIRVNPRNGVHTFAAAITPARRSIPVSSAISFYGAASVVRKTVTGSLEILSIDRGYTSGRFINGLDTASNPDSIRLAADATFAKDDVIYAFATEQYKLNGTNLVRIVDGTTNVFAENIDSLAMVFYTKGAGHVATTVWNSMVTTHIAVRARTAAPDPRYTHPTKLDGYRRVTLTMDLRLRNRF